MVVSVLPVSGSTFLVTQSNTNTLKGAPNVSASYRGSTRAFLSKRSCRVMAFFPVSLSSLYSRPFGLVCFCCFLNVLAMSCADQRHVHFCGNDFDRYLIPIAFVVRPFHDPVRSWSIKLFGMGDIAVAKDMPQHDKRDAGRAQVIVAKRKSGFCRQVGSGIFTNPSSLDTQYASWFLRWHIAPLLFLFGPDPP